MKPTLDQRIMVLERKRRITTDLSKLSRKVTKTETGNIVTNFKIRRSNSLL
jgi:hypothetical protein